MFSVMSFAQDLQKITNDKDFINYINNNNNFIKKANNKELVYDLWADKKISEDELPKFYDLFSTNEVQFQKFTKEQDYLLNIILDRYKLKNYSNTDLIKIINPYINEVYNLDTNSSTTEKRNCTGVYHAQLIFNASVAVGASIACGAADLTIIGGILCHSAVLAGQVAANYIALEDYKDCVRGQRK
jgi:hypothetical protein